MATRTSASLTQVKSAARSPVRRTDYHHGALRAALLDAAQALLLEVGVDGFSLRECAKRAGVSHGAPAHHFGDVKGLLTAFASVGFERMAQRMHGYAEAAGDDADRRLAAVGQAYIDFALENPAHFRLMFRCDRLNASDEPLQQAGAAAAQALAWALSAALERRGVGAETLPERCLLAWSGVHGLAMLLLDADLRAFGVHGRSVEEARVPAARMIDRLLGALLGK